jgi:hypothetical protein
MKRRVVHMIKYLHSKGEEAGIEMRASRICPRERIGERRWSRRTSAIFVTGHTKPPNISIRFSCMMEDSPHVSCLAFDTLPRK